MKITQAKAKKAGLEALAILLGLTSAKVAMMFANGKIPAWAGPLLGVLGFAPHFLDSDDFLKTLGSAAIAAGGAVALQNLTAGKTGMLKTVNDYLPALNATQIIAVDKPAGGGTAGLRGLGQADMYARLVSGLGQVPPQYAMLVG